MHTTRLRLRRWSTVIPIIAWLVFAGIGPHGMRSVIAQAASGKQAPSVKKNDKSKGLDSGASTTRREAKPSGAEAAGTQGGKQDLGPRSKRSKDVAPPTDDPSLGKQLYQRMLNASAWVVAMPPESDHYSWGTAWLVDKNERLLVTNHHVVWLDGGIPVHDEANLRVYFPEYRDGHLLNSREERLNAGTWYHAKLIDSDPARDLALLVVDEIPADAEPLPLAAQSASPGDRIHSLGNPGASSALWVYTSGTVRQVYQTRDWLRDVLTDYMRLETQSPTNTGDSGGPAVNDRGEIVAVNHASLTGESRLMTYMVDVSELKAYLKEARPWLHPETAEDFNDRGVRYYEHERYDEAIRDFSESARLDPKLSDAISNRGWCFLQKGDHATAIADFDAAINAHDTDANYFQGRGLAYAAAGVNEKAVTDFTQAIRLQGDTADYYHDRGEAYYAMEEYPQALSDYEQASRLEPTHAEYYNCAGVTLDIMGEHAKAVEAYARAIEFEPDNGTFYYNRATTYRTMGDDLNASFDLMRMERADPEYAKSKRDRFERRYLRITNDTDEPLQVWVMYHTVTSNDEWKWFPADPSEGRWAVYSFAPGESSRVTHEGFRVNADRVRIWAGNAPRGESWEKSTHMWTTYEKQDLVFVDEGGEEGYFMGEYNFHLK